MLPWIRRLFDVPTPQPSLVKSLPPPMDHSATPEGIFLAASLRYLEVQISTWDVLDTRNAGAFSIGSTVLPLTFGLLAVSDREVPARALGALGAALACYLALTIASWVASLFRRIEFRPDPVVLADISERYSPELLQRWVALEYLESSQANERRLVWKGRCVGLANTLLYFEGLALSLAGYYALELNFAGRLWETIRG